MRKAVYAGSFDPITNGHLWMIEQGVGLFDELVVAIGINPGKKYTFSLEDRLKVIDEVIWTELSGYAEDITIASFENDFLVAYAKHIGADYILRGIRDVKDYEFERGIRHVNSDLHADIKTVFLIPPREITEVSSSLVKGLVGPNGWEDIVKKYVPQAVFELIHSSQGGS
jgi:pantetheine-phosphate adenylyltransferase